MCLFIRLADMLLNWLPYMRIRYRIYLTTILYPQTTTPCTTHAAMRIRDRLTSHYPTIDSNKIYRVLPHTVSSCLYIINIPLRRLSRLLFTHLTVRKCNSSGLYYLVVIRRSLHLCICSPSTYIVRFLTCSLNRDIFLKRAVIHSINVSRRCPLITPTIASANCIIQLLTRILHSSRIVAASDVLFTPRLLMSLNMPCIISDLLSKHYCLIYHRKLYYNSLSPRNRIITFCLRLRNVTYNDIPLCVPIGRMLQSVIDRLIKVPR